MATPTEQSPTNSTEAAGLDYVQRFVQSRFGRKVLDILYETAVMLSYIGAIALLHNLLGKWLGQDAKLFNRIPVSYIIDTGHILAVTRFLLEVFKNVLEAVSDVFASAIYSFRREKIKDDRNN